MDKTTTNRTRTDRHDDHAQYEYPIDPPASRTIHSIRKAKAEATSNPPTGLASRCPAARGSTARTVSDPQRDPDRPVRLRSEGVLMPRSGHVDPLGHGSELAARVGYRLAGIDPGRRPVEAGAGGPGRLPPRRRQGRLPAGLVPRIRGHRSASRLPAGRATDSRRRGDRPRRHVRNRPHHGPAGAHHTGAQSPRAHRSRTVRGRAHWGVPGRRYRSRGPVDGTQSRRPTAGGHQGRSAVERHRGVPLRGDAIALKRARLGGLLDRRDQGADDGIRLRSVSTATTSCAGSAPTTGRCRRRAALRSSTGWR